MAAPEEKAWTHRYHWANNETRAAIKGERCLVERRGARGTVLILTESGKRMTTSLRGLRRIR